MKLVFRARTAAAGVHILGEEATELVHWPRRSSGHGGAIDEFIDTTFNFPTRADTYKYAAYQGLQRIQGRAAGGGPGSAGPPSVGVARGVVGLLIRGREAW